MLFLKQQTDVDEELDLDEQTTFSSLKVNEVTSEHSMKFQAAATSLSPTTYISFKTVRT